MFTQLAFVMQLHANVFLLEFHSEILCEYKACIVYNWAAPVPRAGPQSPDPLLLELLTLQFVICRQVNFWLAKATLFLSVK